MTWLEPNFRNSDKDLLERGKGVYRPLKYAAKYFFSSRYVSMPRYGMRVPDRDGYPLIDIYAYKKPNSPLTKAFSDTRIPADYVPGVNIAGYEIRERYYKRKRLAGFWLTLPSVLVMLVAVVAAIMMMM